MKKSFINNIQLLTLLDYKFARLLHPNISRLCDTCSSHWYKLVFDPEVVYVEPGAKGDRTVDRPAVEVQNTFLFWWGSDSLLLDSPIRNENMLNI